MKRAKRHSPVARAGYDDILAGVVDLLEAARRTSARAVNAIMTATYWEIGRRIVEVEQGGEEQAEYGSTLLKRLAADLTGRFGRGFSWRNLYQMRGFYLAYSDILQTPSAKSLGQTPSDLSANSGGEGIFQTPSAKSPSPAISETPPRKFSGTSSILQTPSEQSALTLPSLAKRFPLPWSHYVRLLKVEKPEARRFYETEALRGGWSVRQLDRQVSTLFYERSLASRNKAAMIRKTPRRGQT